MIDIYMTSFFRFKMTKKSVDFIHERTAPGTFQIHIYDNGSDKHTRESLYGLLDEGKIVSLHLDSRNTGCLYNKGIFQMMTEIDQKYYVVTDNDVYPPKLTPDWLQQMTEIMDRESDIALLTPQLPPQFLQEPDIRYGVHRDFVYCKAVGNTFKMVRRAVFPLDRFQPKLLKYGDDGIVSQYLRDSGWKIAFCRNIYCYHAGQCLNWGYEEKEIDLDPRKQGYGAPFVYPIKNDETWEPANEGLKI